MCACREGAGELGCPWSLKSAVAGWRPLPKAGYTPTPHDANERGAVRLHYPSNLICEQIDNLGAVCELNEGLSG